MRQLFLLAIISCWTVHVLGQKTKSLDSVSYFPKSIYSEVDRIDSMSFIWYSEMLGDFDEPKLFSPQQGNSVYRFTWTRSFHEIMIIRMTISGGSGTLITKTEVRQPFNTIRKRIKLQLKTMLLTELTR
jgi:hypothetical protein